MKNIQQDIAEFVQTFELAEQLKNSSFLITGATGLIGSTLVYCLLALNKEIEITIPIRNLDKVNATYGKNVDMLNVVQCDLLEYVRNLKEHYDYVIHCASPTMGKYMTEYPVEIYSLAIDTTKALLEYSKSCNVRSLVYISSVECYGQILDDRVITEDVQGYVDYTSSRSSYPLGKRAAEFLCVAYAHEYGVSAKVARLTQTFGAGAATDDNRVFAQFARSVVAGTDIILHTAGKSAKPYCYTTDCVSAVLYILLNGEKGEAYNVANESTYISIKDMAEFLRDNFNPNIDIRVELHPEMGYASVTRLRLCSKKLMDLGWKPKYGLKEMFERLIESIN